MHVRFHAVCVKSPSNITVRDKTKWSWNLWHINLTNTQQNYKVLHTRVCTSRRITLGWFARHSRESASLARVLNTFCYRTLSVIETCDAQPGLHTLEHGSAVIDLLFCDEVLGNRLVSSEWISRCGKPRWQPYRRCRNNQKRRARSTPSLKLVHLPWDWTASWWTRLSIQRFSKSHLPVIVPPFHFLDNLSMALNVLHRWFALLQLLRNASQTQVVPGADGPEKVAKTTKQASSWVPLLLPTLARERTFQNVIGIHFCTGV